MAHFRGFVFKDFNIQLCLKSTGIFFLAFLFISVQNSFAKENPGDPRSQPFDEFIPALSFSSTRTLLELNRPVALYGGVGVWGLGFNSFKKMLKTHGVPFKVIYPSQIIKGELQVSLYSALIMPGGKSWKYLESLGEEGNQKVRDFVYSGGGYIGICAGAFFAVSNRLDKKEGGGSYGIGLLNGVAFDGESFGIRDFKKGMHWFPFSFLSFKSWYRILMLGGPSFRFSREEAIQKRIEILARFRYSKEPAVIRFHWGLGRVFLSGPHPEVEENQYFSGIVWHDPDSEWPWLSKNVDWVRQFDTDSP